MSRETRAIWAALNIHHDRKPAFSNMEFLAVIRELVLHHNCPCICLHVSLWQIKSTSYINVLETTINYIVALCIKMCLFP